MALTKVSCSEISLAAKGLKSTCEKLRADLQKLEAVKEKLQIAWTDTTSEQTARKYIEKIDDRVASLRSTIAMLE